MSPVVWVERLKEVNKHSFLLSAIESADYSLPSKDPDLIAASNLEEVLWLALNMLTYFLEFLNIQLVIKPVDKDAQICTLLKFIVSLLL